MYAPGDESRRIACKMGMVFQQFNLFPHMTVLENLIEAPVQVQKRNRDEVIEEAKVLLSKVGLLEKAHEYPRRLSGGSSSAWPLQGRWQQNLPLCCLTNLLHRLTRN